MRTTGGLWDLDTWRFPKVVPKDVGANLTNPETPHPAPKVCFMETPVDLYHCLCKVYMYIWSLWMDWRKTCKQNTHRSVLWKTCLLFKKKKTLPSQNWDASHIACLSLKEKTKNNCRGSAFNSVTPCPLASPTSELTVSPGARARNESKPAVIYSDL